MAESNEAPFSISITGEVTGEKWVGDFVAKKRLSHRDALKKDRTKRELLGGQPGDPSERALSIAIILSELDVRLVSSPRWWKEKSNGLDLEDEEVLVEIYNKALEVETKDIEERKAKAQGAIEAMRAAQKEEAPAK